MRWTARKVLFRVLGALALLIVCGLGGVLAWRANLAYTLNKKLAAIRAAGLPTNGAELNDFYPTVPDKQNAALVMMQAFALLQNFPDDRATEVAQFEIPTPLHLSPKQKQLLTEYVKLNAGALAKVSEAVALPRSRYPADLSRLEYGAGWKASMFRELARGVEFEALLALDAGRPNDANHAIKNLLGMARTLDDMPTMFSCAVRMTLINLACETFHAHANHGNWKADELASFATAFASVENTNVLIRAIAGERANYIPIYLLDPAKINQFRTKANDPGMWPWYARWLVIGTGFRDLELCYYLDTEEAIMAAASSPPPHKFDFAKASETAKRRLYLFTAITMVNLPFELNDRSIANLRLCQTAIANEQFRLARGKLPDKLDELVPQFLPAVPRDPFDGQPLRYHRLEKGYVIYSVGRDGKDDGGRERPATAKSTDKTPYDIPFTIER